MEIAFWASTDVGHVREHNEDNFLVDKRLRLFVVCDGMGGHAAGEVASAMSVRVVREVISEKREIIERVNETPEDPELRREVLNHLEYAITEANRRVFESSREDESRRGMGTTCVVLLLTNKKAFIGHVGDSRVYLVRQQQVHQLTEDHSLYNEMVRLGKIRPGDNLNLPNKNAVTRAVGVRETVEVDTLEIDILEDDRFLACSDGLCGYFKAEEQIRMVLGGDDVKAVTELCIAFALDCGGKDNVTAIVVDVVKQEDGSRHTQEVELTMDLLKTIPYFQYLGYKERVQVMNLARVEEVRAGTDVLDAIEDPAAFMVVLQGVLEMRRGGESPMRLGAGSYAGEVGFIDGQPHEFEVFAREESILLVFERKQFMELLRRDPELAVKLLWNFLQMFTIKVRELSLPMAELTMFPLDEGVAGKQEDLIRTMTLPQFESQLDDAFPGELPLDELAADASAEQPQAPVKIRIPSPSDEPVSLSETTETPEGMDALDDADETLWPSHQRALEEPTPEEQDEPEEDLRATMQLDWAAINSFEEPTKRTPPLNLQASAAPATPAAPAAGPPPLPGATQAAAAPTLKPPTLPTPSGKLPPLPQRPKKTPPPLGRGISGESGTVAEGANVEEEATLARVDALPSSLVEPSAPRAPEHVEASPFSLFDEDAAEPERAEVAPPRAAVMKRGRRGRGMNEASLSEESMPLGMREPSGESGDDDRPPELVATVQLNLNDIHLGDEEEPPTKQLQRPGLDDLSKHEARPPSKPGTPSSKVQVNFGLDDN